MSVLAAVDFSKNSHKALRVASRIARDSQRRLVVVNCVESADEDAFWRHLVETPWEVPNQIRRVAKARLVNEVNDALDTNERPDEIDYVVELDSSADGIIAAREKNDAELVVIGATGSSKFKNRVFGSTADRVVRTSPVPVFSVATDAPEDGFKTILAPVDFSEASRASLQTAIELARSEGARLLIMHAFVLPAASLALLDLQPPAHAIEAYESQQWIEFDKFVDDFDLDDIEHDRLLLIGSPATAIERVAQEHNVQLVCMGTNGRTGVRRYLLGNTASRVLRGMPCSVLTVPHPEAHREES